MKHDFPIVLWLILLFIISQLFGLFLLTVDIQEVAVDESTGSIQVVYEETALGPRPATQGVGSFLYLALGVGIGTGLLLILIHFRKLLTWKIWFFFAVAMATTLALGVFLPSTVAFLIAVVLALWKLIKPNVVVHNLTEVFMYAGIALFLAPLFDLLWGVILLLAISLYDMYAVWKSKHMVKMATFLTDSKAFAGLSIPYRSKTSSKKTKGHKKVVGKKKMAILGGGDMAFPLIFAGTVLVWLIQQGFDKTVAFYVTLLIPLFATLALSFLFWKSEKGKFYPAMPFLSAGCFLGLACVGVVQLLI